MILGVSALRFADCPLAVFYPRVYAWNAHREGKAIQNIKHDPKKGLYDVHE
jgi:hypothetical protein